MFSKIVCQFALKAQPRVAPRAFNRLMTFSQRGYLEQLGLESTSTQEVTAATDKKGEVSLWKDISKNQEQALVLKQKDEIEKYVLSVVRNYFRTTRKSNVTLESQFKDHGLDSLDVVELIIQVEDELGYVIDAENLRKFQKPKHFVNFITQMEAYKSEMHKLPHEGVHASFSLGEAFPGMPGTGKKKSGGH